MKVTLFCFTIKGAKLCEKIQTFLNVDDVTACYSKYEGFNLLPMNDKLFDLTKAAFENSKTIVFVGAAGIAVRAIAPFINSKATDPGVIVIDENGQNVIPILSGHLGGANRMAEKIAALIHGRAVITTATDINNIFAIDVWANDNELFIRNIENIKYISAALLNDEKIGIICDYPLDGVLPDFFTDKDTKAGICIADDTTIKPFLKTLYLTPKRYVIGIGCRKNVKEDVLQEFVLDELGKLGIPTFLINCIATIDIKTKEKAILSMCRKYSYPLKAYTSKELSEVKGDFTASEFVKSVVGVDNVCERAAAAASNYGEMILKKTTGNSLSMAITKKKWRCNFECFYDWNQPSNGGYRV